MSTLLSVVMAWEMKLGVRRTVVLFVTLWMTYRAFEWAARYAMSGLETSGAEAAAIILAVTGPVSYLQKCVFESYLKSKEVV